MCSTGRNMTYRFVPRAFNQSRNQFSGINRVTKSSKTTITPKFFMPKHHKVQIIQTSINPLCEINIATFILAINLPERKDTRTALSYSYYKLNWPYLNNHNYTVISYSNRKQGPKRSKAIMSNFKTWVEDKLIIDFNKVITNIWTLYINTNPEGTPYTN